MLIDVRRGAVILVELSTGTVLKGMVSELTSSTLKLRSVGFSVKLNTPVFAAVNETNVIRRSAIIRWHYLRKDELPQALATWETKELPAPNENGLWLGSGEEIITADV